MSVRLLVKQRSQAGGSDKDTEVLLDEEEILLGRDKSCQVVLAEQAVSRSHARISRDGALCFLEDLGSAYGTLINGKSIPKGEKRLLRNGDVIGIAQFDLTFARITEAPKGSRNEKTSMVARQAVKDVMRGLGKGEGPYFRYMNGANEGRKIEVPDAAELVFGREEGVDVVLPDDLVSRRHAKVRRDWSGTHVEDLESRNGIRVNKKRITRKTLHDRDELEIGSVRLLYLDPSEVREAPVVLSQEEAEDGVEATVAQEADDVVNPEPSGEEPMAAGTPAAPEMAAANEPLLEAAPPEEGSPEEGLDGDGNMDPDGRMGMGAEDSQMMPPAEGRGTLGTLAKHLKDPKILIPVVAMTLFALGAVVITVLVFVGA